MINLEFESGSNCFDSKLFVLNDYSIFPDENRINICNMKLICKEATFNFELAEDMCYSRKQIVDLLHMEIKSAIQNEFLLKVSVDDVRNYITFSITNDIDIFNSYRFTGKVVKKYE